MFKFPVVDDENDDGELPECNLANHPDRLQLLKATKVIFWDEFISNHREILESIVQFLPDVIFIFAGDFRQILPVIERGTIHDIIAATIISSSYWQRFETLSLIKNMRLKSGDSDNIRYSEALLDIGEGRSHPDAFVLHRDGNESIIALPKMEVFVDRQKAIDWLYPEGQPLATDRVILAVTNTQVNEWNTEIQQRNSNETHVLRSHDTFADSFDPNGYLADVLTGKHLYV